MQQHAISVARKQAASNFLPFSGNEMEFIRLRLLTLQKRNAEFGDFFFGWLEKEKEKSPNREE